MAKPILKINTRVSSYQQLLNLALKVLAFLTANIGLFPTPNPTLVQLTTHITALKATIAAWGSRKNRGSKADFIALKVAATDVRNDLVLLMAYVSNTVDLTLPNDVQLANFTDSGFEVKNVRSKITALGPVQNLHQKVKKSVVEPDVLLKWTKPQELLTGTRLRAYNIYKNDVFQFSVTKTSLIVVRPAGVTGDKYTVKPVNDLGEWTGRDITVAGKGA